MLEFPPATPFTYHVTIVVVVLVSVVLDSATCAVNSTCSLICTVADAGEIVTEVTVMVPPLPQDEIPSRQASATGSSNIPRIPFRIEQPSLPALFTSGPAPRTISFSIRAASAGAATPVIRFLLCCLVICLGRSSAALLPARRSRTHTSIPVFPFRKKKFPCLEVSAQDSVARQLLIPRAPHPVRRQSSYINRFRCHTRNRHPDDATSIVILRPAPLLPVGGRISRAFPPPARPEPRTRFRGAAIAVAPSCHKML